MKFTSAWADIAAQNINLKVATIFLSLTTMSLGVCVIKLATKDPLVIERGCVTKSLALSGNIRTQQEIEAFVKEGLSQRFDMDNHDTFLLSEDERMNRTQEDKELKSKDLKQRVIINNVKIDGAAVQVDTDRLLSIGQVRSVVSFPLTVILTTIDRTPVNPYGLLLQKVSSQKKTEK